MRSLLGDAKRRTRREVVDVGSVEKGWRLPPGRDRIVGNDEEKRTTFVEQNLEQMWSRYGEKRNIP